MPKKRVESCIAAILGGAVLGTPLSGETVESCPRSEFAEVLRLLGADGDLNVSTSSAALAIEVRSGSRVLWTGRFPTQDCLVAVEVTRLQVERRLEPPPTSPIGEIPKISVVRPALEAPGETPRAPDWHLELGASGQWEATRGRLGGAAEAAVRHHGGLGGRLELGAFAPLAEAAGELRQTSFVSLHALLFAEGCWKPFAAVRMCGALGGGLDRVEAWADGERVFRPTTQGSWAARLDGEVSSGWGSNPFNLELFLRLTLRPDPTRIWIEGIDLENGLEVLALATGLRARMRFL